MSSQTQSISQPQSITKTNLSNGTGELYLYAALAASIFVIFIFRKPDCVLNPQFWAEDGKVYFRDEIVYGFFPSLLAPYRGYFQPISRIVAAIFAVFPVRYAPLLYNLSALVIDSLCCALFFLRRYRRLIPADGLRFVLCLLAATAFDTREIVGTIANSQWYVLLAGLLLFAVPPDARMPITRWLWIGFAFFLGFSVPMLIIAAPLALYRLPRRNDLYSALMGVGISVGALLPSIFAMFAKSGLVFASPTPLAVGFALWVGLAQKVLLQSLIGFPRTWQLARGGHGVIAVIAFIMFALWLAWLCSGPPRPRRLDVVSALYLMVASVLLSLIGRSIAQYVSVAQFPDRGERYYFLASCIFAYLVAVALERIWRWDWQSGKAILLAAIFAGGILGNFRVPPFMDMHWPAYASAITSWKEHKSRGEESVGLSVPINPPGWYIELPAQEAQNGLQKK